MKKSISFLLPFFLILITILPGCEVVGGIFKAGMWVGVILVVLVIAVIFWLINKAKK